MQGTQPDTALDGQRSSSSNPTREIESAARLGRFVVLGRIGAGGMGIVVSAYDPELDRKIAIKLVRPSTWAHGDAGGRARAMAEARAMARLSHPNVVTVYEVGAVEDGLYVAMEFVRGSTTREWAAAGRTAQEIAEVFAQIARGLDAVHRAGLVHRDVKPDNLMVRDDGRAQVLDFGIARTLGELDASGEVRVPPDEGRETEDRGIVGTPAYLSPEIYAGIPADARSDQWALCVAMYELLYGQRPFAGSSLLELAAAISEARPATPPKGHEVPRRIHAVLARGLSSAPARRWPSLAAFADALDEARGARRSGRWWLLGGAATIGAFAFARSLAPDAADCHATRAPMDAVWHDARSNQLREAFTAAVPSIGGDAWDHTRILVDEYAQSWIAARHDTCEAATVTRLQSERVMDLRLACLEQRHQGFVALLDALEHPDTSDVEHAIAAVAGLSSVAECSAEAIGLGGVAAPPEHVEEIAEIRRELASLVALYHLGRLDALPDRVAALRARAEATGYAAVRGEVTETWGDIAAELGDFPSAAAAHGDAYVLAREAADRTMAARNATSLASVVGPLMGDLDEATRWLRVAEIERPAGSLAELDGAMVTTRGNILYARGQFAAALAAYDDGIARVGPGAGAQLERLAMESNRAVVLTQLGRIDEAVATAREVVARVEEVYGEEHPAIATELGALAAALTSTGDYAAAAEVARRAIAVREQAFGPDSTSLAAPLAVLAGTIDTTAPAEAREACSRALVLFERISPDHQGILTCRNLIALSWMEQHEDALARVELERTRVLAEARLGKQHPDYATVLNNLAYVEHRLGDLEAAETWSRAAVDILRSSGSDQLLSLTKALSKLGRLQLERGDARAALSTLEEAMGTLTETNAPPLVGETELALAQAIVATGGDTSRAIELATHAREALSRAQPVDPQRLAVVDAWLADRTGQPSSKRRIAR